MNTNMITPEASKQAHEYLAAVFMPGDWGELRMIGAGGASSRWFQLGDDQAVSDALTWAAKKNAADEKPANVYIGVNPRKGDGLKGDANVVLARVVFADFDGGTTPEQAIERIAAANLPAPSMVIASGGGTHVYWRLAEPLADLERFKAIQKALAGRLNSDKTIHNPERIMRLPGFDNVKPDRPGRPPCRIVEHKGGTHDVAAFPVNTPPAAGARTRPPRGPAAVKRGGMGDASRAFIDHGQLLPSGGRRETMFTVACDLAARGWGEGEAVAVIMPRMQAAGLAAEDLADCPRQIHNAFSKPREAGHDTAAHRDELHDGAADLTRSSTWLDVGLARRLAKQIRGRLVYVRERCMWLAFDGRRWAERADHVAVQEAKRMHDELWLDLAKLGPEERKAALRFVQTTGTKKTIDAVLGLTKTEPGINVSQADFDSHPWLLNVENGVVDLRSGELLPHDPELRITQLASVAYDPDARSELWGRFMREVTCGDDEIAGFLQQSFGIALTGDVSDEVLHCHNGNGCNGKSTALEAIRAMLGDYAGVASPGLFMARNFDSHPTEVAALHNKRFVTAIEQEANRALRESLVKSLTGGDTIRTRRMREDFWEMRPTWHIHIAYNRAPRLTGTDDGIRRRLRVVPWAASFKDCPDPSIKERLLGVGERAGILAWCMEGLRHRLAAGRLESPQAVLTSTDDYIEDEDLVGRFIEDCCSTEDPRAEAEIRETLAAFKRWMQADGTPRHVADSYTANMLGRELVRRGFQKRRPDHGVHRKRTVYTGMRLALDCEYAQSGEDWGTF
jgi:P4 family phage/plasmid primase-like protien